jgi:hypothetical protein
MKIKSTMYLAFGLLAASVIVAADAPKYTPTEVQSLRLQVKQRDAQLAQQAVLNAQEKFQAILAALNAEGEKVRLENKWPDTVKFSPDRLDFTEAPAPVLAAKPAVPAPAKP